jgi:hypothetical protein
VSRAAGQQQGELMMVVRAARALDPGDEVTISYAGRFTSSPTAPRRELLRRSYGFSCSCERCQAEERVAGGAAAAAAGEAYAELEGRLRPQVMRAVRAEDLGAVRQLSRRLQEVCRRWVPGGGVFESEGGGSVEGGWDMRKKRVIVDWKRVHLMFFSGVCVPAA